MANLYTAEELLSLTRDSLSKIGYRNSLLRDNYRFADPLGRIYRVQTIALAGFAQEPPSYRNACFGVVVPDQTGPELIKQYRALGAPQILALYPQHDEIHRYKMVAHGMPELLERIEPSHLQQTILQHADQWSPDQVLRAKSINFTRTPIQLDFFDLGLIPALEKVVQKKLDHLLSEVLASCKRIYAEIHGNEPPYEQLFRLIFRLIAAKLLADRDHEGDWTQRDVQAVIRAVESFYFQRVTPEPVLNDKIVQQAAWDKIRTAFHFQNLSVETLAYVYENTLVSTETRRQHGTHATPSEIAEYVVQHMPIGNLAQDERTIFEPFAGHAPFLIAALGQLRTLLSTDMDATQRHDYFVRMLSGMEVDPFAREVARYSLMLADYPNPNGWHIELGNAFTSPLFDTYSSKSNIVLCNPPYENFTIEERYINSSIQSANKAAEALRRVLHHHPRMLGFVLPRSFISGQMYKSTRQEMLSRYENIDVVAMPKGVFQHSKAETVLLIAYGQRVNQTRFRSIQVGKENYSRFIQGEQPTWQTEIILSDLDDSDPVFWHTPLEQVWKSLAKLPRFGSVAEVHRGIEYNVPFKENAALLVAEEAKPGFAPGLGKVQDGLESYTVTSHKYLNIDPRLMLYEAYKLPWHQPKVIANAAYLGVARWTIVGAVDEQGLVCYQNFHGIWPRNDTPVEVIAALLNGPVANAFLSTYRTSRGNQKRIIEKIPVPVMTLAWVQSVVALVQEYRLQRSEWLRHPERRYIYERVCNELVQQIDAEVLKAYNLAPSLEQAVLNYFVGYKRPSPVGFARYSEADVDSSILFPHNDGVGANTNVWDLLESLAGSMEAPSDWSDEHDHYLYNTPKRRDTPES